MTKIRARVSHSLYRNIEYLNRIIMDIMQRENSVEGLRKSDFCNYPNYSFLCNFNKLSRGYLLLDPHIIIPVFK